MANPDNLKKGNPATQFKSGRKAAEAGRKGGIASGEAKRRKKSMQSAAKMLLDMPITSKELKQKLKALGVDEEDATYQMGIMVGMLQSAMKGNTKAAAFLRDTAGESPTTKIREKELNQRKTEFEFNKEIKSREVELSGEEDTLADAIVEAYEKRMESEGKDDDIT